MASIKTDKGREKLAKAHAGTAALPAVTHIVFGSGGTNVDGTPKALTGAENALFNEVKRKVPVKTFPVVTTSRYASTLNALTDALVGVNINEAGLIDADGDLVAMKTFTSKGMDADTIIDFEYDAEF